MKRMYAILFAVFAVMAVLVIGVIVGDRQKNRPSEEPSQSAVSTEETTQETTEKKERETERPTSPILPSLPFTSTYSFQAAKVKEVLGDNRLSLELYDGPDEAKSMEGVRHFDFTPFSATGSVDNDYLVYSFCFIYEVKDEEFYRASYDDIGAGDMVLCLEDYSRHRYILVYKQA